MLGRDFCLAAECLLWSVSGLRVTVFGSTLYHRCKILESFRDPTFIQRLLSHLEDDLKLSKGDIARALLEHHVTVRTSCTQSGFTSEATSLLHRARQVAIDARRSSRLHARNIVCQLEQFIADHVT